MTEDGAILAGLPKASKPFARLSLDAAASVSDDIASLTLGGHMQVKRARSPNYPAIGLGKAIELISKLYDKAHTNKAPAAVVASALGYTGLNGSSLGIVSALRKYGLLELVGAEYRVSQDGLSLAVDPRGSTDWARAVLRAAFSPNLFAELRQEYGDKPPATDDYLRPFLLKKGFVQSAVDVPIRAYRDTMKLVEQANAVLGEVELGDKALQELENGDQSVSNADHVAAALTAPVAPTQPLPVPWLSPASPKPMPPNLHVAPQEREWLRGSLSKAYGSSFRVLIAGDVNARAIGNLIKLLEAQKAVLEDDDELPPMAS